MKLPGHKLERKVGQGGMAAVYLGVQEAFDRKVAVKILEPKTIADEEFAARFLREAKTVAQLSHRHIIPVYDFGSLEGYYYMSMEYLPGGTLDGLAKAGLELEEALVIIEQVADALNYAHSKGIIHRDVKPENIMFRDDHSAVLMDFGIARRQDASDGMTVAGAVLGTPKYMSPEQIQGRDLDGRSDIYALGIMFYEMLMRQVPYESEDYMALAMKHLKEPIPRLTGKLAKAQHFLEKMLAKNIDQRFQTCEQVMNAARQLRETGEFVSGTKVTRGGLKDEVKKKAPEPKQALKQGAWFNERKTKSGLFSNKYQYVVRTVSEDYNRFTVPFNTATDKLIDWHRERKGSCESVLFDITIDGESETKVRSALRKLIKTGGPLKFLKKIPVQVKFTDYKSGNSKNFTIKTT